MSGHLPLPILPQPDDVTCGPTCLQAVYGYWFDVDGGDAAFLRERLLRQVRLKTSARLDSVTRAYVRFGGNPLAGHDQHYAVGIDRLLGAIVLGVPTYDGNLLLLEPPGAAASGPRRAGPGPGQAP